MMLSLILFVCLGVSFVVAKPTGLQKNAPANFDARTKWPECPSISEVSDQGSCKGAGWAIAVADALADRYCIASKGKQASLRLSALQLLQCIPNKITSGTPFQPKTPRTGVCDTSDVFSGVSFSGRFGPGLVSGGSFGSKNGCKPYPFDRHTDVSTIPFKCEQTCDNHNYSVPFDNDLHQARGLSWSRLFLDGTFIPGNIYDEISTYGPGSTTMDVYESFAHLSGDQIYQQGPNDSKPLLVQHGVRVIGWGSEAGVDFWLVVNSYGTKWGNNGTFRVRRGHNDFRFEENFSLSRV